MMDKHAVKTLIGGLTIFGLFTAVVWVYAHPYAAIAVAIFGVTYVIFTVRDR